MNGRQEQSYRSHRSGRPRAVSHGRLAGACAGVPVRQQADAKLSENPRLVDSIPLRHLNFSAGSSRRAGSLRIVFANGTCKGQVFFVPAFVGREGVVSILVPYHPARCNARTYGPGPFLQVMRQVMPNRHRARCINRVRSARTGRNSTHHANRDTGTGLSRGYETLWKNYIGRERRSGSGSLDEQAMTPDDQESASGTLDQILLRDKACGTCTDRYL